MSDAENSPDFSSLDGTLQLGDTELLGVPGEEIAEKYSSEDINQIVYHGDASKKVQEGPVDGEGEVPDDVYLDQLEETYETLDSLGEELEADVLTLPGNHDPISGAHYGDEEKVGRIEEMLEEEYDEFADYDGNAFEFFIDSHDNLVNFVDGVYETEDGNTIIGMSDHLEPELGEEDFRAYQFTKSDEPGMDELGYGDEKLGEVAELLEDQHEPDYGFLGGLTDIPYVGKYLEGAVEWIGEKLGYGEIDIDPESLELEDIPEDERTEEHIERLEMLEEVEENEKVQEFIQKIEDIAGKIESAEGDVMLVHHSIPYGENAEYGSMIASELMREYGDEIDLVTGGHMHGNGIYELEDTPVINAAETYTEIGLGSEELYAEQHEIRPPQPEPRPEPQEESGAELPQQPGPEITEEIVEQRAQEIPDEAAEQIAEQQFGMEIGEIVDETGWEREEALERLKRNFVEHQMQRQAAEEPEEEPEEESERSEAPEAPGQEDSGEEAPA